MIFINQCQSFIKNILQFGFMIGVFFQNKFMKGKEFHFVFFNQNQSISHNGSSGIDAQNYFFIFHKTNVMIKIFVQSFACIRKLCINLSYIRYIQHEEKCIIQRNVTEYYPQVALSRGENVWLSNDEASERTEPRRTGNDGRCVVSHPS